MKDGRRVKAPAIQKKKFIEPSSRLPKPGRGVPARIAGNGSKGVPQGTLKKRGHSGKNQNVNSNLDEEF